MTWPGKFPPRNPPDWRCRCGAKNAGKDAGCEGCGAANPRRRWRGSRAVPLPSPVLTSYPEPTPEDRVQAKASLATIREMLRAKKGGSP